MATRKRKRTKARRRGIGNVFQERVRAKVAAMPKPTRAAVAKARAQTRRELCAEDHYEYCTGKRKKRARELEEAFATMPEPKKSKTRKWTTSAMGRRARPAAPAPSAAKVRKSEAKAERKGCVAPKGRVCVDKSVARIKNKLRDGCRASKVAGTYICTENAVKAHGAGKNRVAGKKAGAGFKFASWKEAIDKQSGKFKAGCMYSFSKRRPICAKSPRKSGKKKAA